MMREIVNSALMEVPLDELKNKKTSFFVSYRVYKNKVKKSENTGAGVDDVYKPIWFAYEIMDNFLGDTTKCKKKLNTEEQPTSRGNEVNTKATAVSTSGRQKHPTKLFEAEKVLKEALSTYNATIKRNIPQSMPKKKTILRLVKVLAIKLRKLSEGKRLRLMHGMDAMFLGLQYTIHSEFSLPVPTPSPKPQYEPRP